ncbi:DUF2510 domain-containing protein [Pseudactinotalea sp. HY158]|uniref:DUF2510 domain-containing protein n=1 Tax=unclassified Pseudactinotalea TaxID=2649176 RepID=UPI00129C7C55|nr:DUF2510 domain-containing protein [Pseudactinotalea sp. HY158]MPV50369.1 DUF2510 domain-containing protein [Pseudactinotalea sp. HY160]QGH68964.1 DUF2510 domain-containing protein [Pseudactinotalea sp. HY158]
MQEPAGWYPDPAEPERDRLWDGEAWTAYTRTRIPGAEPGPPDLTGTSAYGYLATSAQADSPMATPMPPDDPRRVRDVRMQRMRTAGWYAIIVLIVLALFIVYGGVALIMS